MIKRYIKGNEYIIDGDIAKIIIISKKYGYFESLIDAKNVERCKNYTWGVHFNLTINKFYITTHFNKPRQTILYLHRLITNCPNNMQVDHIDGNTFDNREQNLRLVTHKQNMENQYSCYDNNKSSGIRGIT